MYSYLEKKDAKSKNYKGVIHANCDDIIDELLENGIKFDLILTDPPYNVGKDFGNKSDKLPLEDYLSIMKKRIFKMKDLLTENGSIIWFGIHNYICYIQVYMYEAGLSYRRLNIWHYENGFSRSKKEPATHFEPFLWFSKNSKQWTYNADLVRVPYKSTERLKSPIKYKDSKGILKTWLPSDKGALRGDVWDFPTLAGPVFKKERTSHPSQKPESLITELIKAHCPYIDNKFNGKILDPFHGSGTLGVCCERLNNQGHNIEWTGIELEENWCATAINRLNQLQNGK